MGRIRRMGPQTETELASEHWHYLRPKVVNSTPKMGWDSKTTGRGWGIGLV